MKKALSVTSPDHAVALAAYFVLALFGLVGVFHLTKSSSIFNAFPEGMADVWSTTLMISAGGSFLSALSAKRSRRPDDYLRMEMIFTLGLGVNLSYLMHVVSTSFGGSGFFTIAFAGAFALGSFARALQIYFDKRRVRKARANPKTESVPVLADPRDVDTERG